jgi:hypothetical protein
MAFMYKTVVIPTYLIRINSRDGDMIIREGRGGSERAHGNHGLDTIPILVLTTTVLYLLSYLLFSCNFIS